MQNWTNLLQQLRDQTSKQIILHHCILCVLCLNLTKVTQTLRVMTGCMVRKAFRGMLLASRDNHVQVGRQGP